MSGEPNLTIIGNLTADPDLRFTPNGAAVVNFTVASTPRTFDRQRNEFVEGQTLFLRCSAWKDLAENIASSLAKGQRVIVTGRVVQRDWEDREGNQRSQVEMQVDEAGPSLRWATASVQRTERNGGARQPQQQRPPQGGWGQPQADPWGGAGNDEAPF